ncbi:MAG: hypothetical protein ACRC4N_08630, partial [Gammaproteobacteria bacterium]
PKYLNTFRDICSNSGGVGAGGRGGTGRRVVCFFLWSLNAKVLNVGFALNKMFESCDHVIVKNN